MALQHFLRPTVPESSAKAVRLGASATPGANLTSVEEGKIVKLAGDSQYDLAAVGNEIEGLVYAVELATQAGWTIGSVVELGRASVVLDGLQASPGTGNVAIGDYVVTGTPVAKGTALATYPKVCKATAAASALLFKWRVVSLLGTATGIPGTVAVIERVL